MKTLEFCVMQACKLYQLKSSLHLSVLGKREGEATAMKGWVLLQ